MKEKILKRNACFLSSLEREHLDDIRQWRNVQMSILRQLRPLTQKSQKDWWEKINKQNQNQYLFSIFSSKEKFIGYCGITNIHHIFRHGEISFLVDPVYEEGTAKYTEIFSEVLSMLCEYGFKNLNLNRMLTETYEFREGHIKVIENFPFAKEGTLQQHVYKNGQYHNCVIHSILKEEYEG